MFVMVNFHDLGDAIALVESFPCGSKTLFLCVYSEISRKLLVGDKKFR